MMTSPKSDTANRRKVIAVASFGGHLVQLQRILAPLSGKHEIIYVTTNIKAKKSSDNNKYYFVEDFSRTSPLKLVSSIAAFNKIIKAEKPDVVISTGAAPGLAAVLIAKKYGIKSLWIDSLANVEHLSVCGRIAAKIATATLTQWPHLATDKIKFYGTIL